MLAQKNLDKRDMELAEARLKRALVRSSVAARKDVFESFLPPLTKRRYFILRQGRRPRDARQRLPLPPHTV